MRALREMPLSHHKANIANLGRLRETFETSPKTKFAFLFLGAIAIALAISGLPDATDTVASKVGATAAIAAGLFGGWLIVKGVRLKHRVAVHERGLFIEVRTLKPMIGAYRWTELKSAELSVHRIYYKGVPVDTNVVTITTRDGMRYALSEYIVGDVSKLCAAINHCLQTASATPART